MGTHQHKNFAYGLVIFSTDTVTSSRRIYSLKLVTVSLGSFLERYGPLLEKTLNPNALRNYYSAVNKHGVPHNPHLRKCRTLHILDSLQVTGQLFSSLWSDRLLFVLGKFLNCRGVISEINLGPNKQERGLWTMVSYLRYPLGKTYFKKYTCINPQTSKAIYKSIKVLLKTFFRAKISDQLTFSFTFSNEDGETTEKQTRNTSVCG